MASAEENKNKSTPPVQVLEDKIGAFRQPVITTTGILLGFVLNFASTWVRNETPMPDWLAWIVGASVVVGVTLLIMVLYRVLRMDYPRENAEFYYIRTLQLLIFGITFSFLGAFIDLFSNFMTD